jgi:peptidoglycan/xylan/chitin deacetylase (PgdA/CDA1 family)
MIRSSLPRRTPAVAACLFIGAMLFFAISGLSGSERSSAAATKIAPQEVTDQIISDIREALMRNIQATSYKQWRQSGYTPEDIFKNVSAMDSTESAQALCLELGRLSPQDLLLFEGALESSSLNCKNPLLAKLQKELASVSPPDMALNVADGQGAVVTLSFEEGPSSAHTPEILDILNDAKVSADFFLDWRNVNQNSDLARSIRRRGNRVGSLPTTELSALELPEKDAREMLWQNQDRVSMIAESHSNLVRLPYGESSPELLEYVRSQNWQNSPWSIESLDWKIRDPQKLVKYVLASVAAAHGGTLLLHDSLGQTQAALPSIIQSLKAHGYVIRSPETAK